MRSDLEGLPITPGEVRRLTGITLINDLKSNLLDDLFVSLTFVLPATIFFVLGFNLLQINFNSILVLIIMAIITLIFGLILFMQKAKIKNNNHLINLINELEKHNNLIGNINVLDQLESVGNPVSVGERERVIQALKINRANLERALKTERILRENPQFRPEQFDIDLTTLKGLAINETATEYGRWLNEALEISLSVQKEMISLQQRGE